MMHAGILHNDVIPVNAIANDAKYAYGVPTVAACSVPGIIASSSHHKTITDSKQLCFWGENIPM